MLTEQQIIEFILSRLSVGSRGKPASNITAVVSALLYRVKTGCQWRLLPMRAFDESHKPLTWQTVYYHFRQWITDGSLLQLWTDLLQTYKKYLDLSSIQLDGSHTIAKGGGQAVDFQTRKKAKTTNMLYIADNQGILIAVSPPIEGNHNDLYAIKEMLQQLWTMIQSAGICLDGCFLNADAGFDAEDVRQACAAEGIETNIAPNPRNGSTLERDEIFDEQLYERRCVIERSNAWLDAYKALLIRFEKRSDTWFALHLLAFAAIFIRKIVKSTQKK
jgi:transposase